MSGLAAGKAYISKDFGAAGTTGTMQLRQQEQVAVSLTGSGMTATVDLERSLDGGTTWGVVQSWSAPAEFDYRAPCGQLLRVNCSSYTSGTPSVRVRKGD